MTRILIALAVSAMPTLASAQAIIQTTTSVNRSGNTTTYTSNSSNGTTTTTTISRDGNRTNITIDRKPSVYTGGSGYTGGAYDHSGRGGR